MDGDVYCREIEAHLCRRNGGHLVRVVGPSFEMVAGWAVQGIPLKVALAGIDRAVERRAAKGPTRRPLRVEFCEGDVLDAFDEWRRAVGVSTAAGGAMAGARTPDEGRQADAEPASRAGHSLRAHLDRVVTRLTDRVASGSLGQRLEPVVEAIIEDVAAGREASRSSRGDARRLLIERLAAIDARLMDAAREAAPADVLAGVERDAEQELAGFRSRMAPDDHARAVRAAATTLLRNHWKLPVVAYE